MTEAAPGRPLLPAPQPALAPGTRWQRRLSVAALVILTPVSLLLALAGYILFWHFRAGSPIGFLLWLKMIIPAYAWRTVWMGVLTAAAGLGLARFFRRAPARQWGAVVLFSLLVAAAGACAAGAGAIYIGRVTASHDGFEQAFGAKWAAAIPADAQAKMLQHRWSPLGFTDPAGAVVRDLPFATVPGRSQPLTADLWLPPAGVKPSGVAFLYAHGSAWHFADKGWGTDPTFRHLAAQGHVVMDVAYRMAPEVEIPGMVADVQRAVLWMKANAAQYGVNPQRIVIGGSSTGGQISLLAAYTPGEETRVAGVVSYYGLTDMRTYYQHEAGQITRSGKRPAGKLVITDPVTHGFIGDFAALNLEQMMLNAMGGQPDEVPQLYDEVDVARHVTPGAPPTLLIQGEYDFITSAGGVRKVADTLRQAGVPVVHHELPWTDHGFDIITDMVNHLGVSFMSGSQYAPPTQTALYDLDRFLGLIAAGAR